MTSLSFNLSSTMLWLIISNDNIYRQIMYLFFWKKKKRNAILSWKLGKKKKTKESHLGQAKGKKRELHGGDGHGSETASFSSRISKNARFDFSEKTKVTETTTKKRVLVVVPGMESSFGPGSGGCCEMGIILGVGGKGSCKAKEWTTH